MVFGIILELFGNFNLGNLAKLALPTFAILCYDTALSLTVKDALMKQDRWQHAFAQNDKDFKELFGVKKEIFLKMHEILTAARENRACSMRI